MHDVTFMTVYHDANQLQLTSIALCLFMKIQKNVKHDSKGKQNFIKYYKCRSSLIYKTRLTLIHKLATGRCYPQMD